MCGRFVLKEDNPKNIKKVLPETKLPPLKPSFNIAPTQPILIIKNSNQIPTGVYCRWGLIPHWTKEIEKLPLMINARVETITEKPSFKSLLTQRRCVIPASGFYEWQKKNQQKIPHYIYADDPIIWFAGLWDEWTSPEGKQIQTCIIITKEATKHLQSLHERMPLLLNSKQLKNWLSNSPLDIKSVLKTTTSKHLTYYPVSLDMNSPKNNSPDCIKKIS